MKELLILSLLFAMFTCNQAPSESSETSSRKINSESLADALAYLAQHCGKNGLDETLVLHQNDTLYAGDSIHRVHDIWSCTKSFTSTAVGLMAAEGLLDLDQPVADHEPLLRERYPTATYRHFLTMTSGYNAEGITRWEGDTSEDWSLTPYVPGKPNNAPGEAFAYWDEAMIMLGRAMTQVLSKQERAVDLNTYLEERLFSKIGIPKRGWWGEGQVNGVDINFGGTGLKLSAAEHARFGQLFLQDGVWEGERLLPEGWVGQATLLQVPPTLPLADTDRASVGGPGHYGFNWWIIPADVEAGTPAAAYTSGLNHNVCLVVPEWDLVVVRQGTDGNPAAGKGVVYKELLVRLAGR